MQVFNNSTTLKKTPTLLKAYHPSALGNILDSSVKKAGIVSARVMWEHFPTLASLNSLRFLRDAVLRNKVAAKVKELRSAR